MSTQTIVMLATQRSCASSNRMQELEGLKAPSADPHSVADPGKRSSFGKEVQVEAVNGKELENGNVVKSHDYASGEPDLKSTIINQDVIQGQGHTLRDNHDLESVSTAQNDDSTRATSETPSMTDDAINKAGQTDRIKTLNSLAPSLGVVSESLAQSASTVAAFVAVHDVDAHSQGHSVLESEPKPEDDPTIDHLTGPLNVSKDSKELRHIRKGLYVGSPSKHPVPQAVMQEWTDSIRDRLAKDIMPILGALPRSVPKRKKVVELDLCMAGNLHRDGQNVHLKPMIWIRCGGKKCKEKVQAALQDLEYHRPLVGGMIYIGLKAPNLAANTTSTVVRSATEATTTMITSMISSSLVSIAATASSTVLAAAQTQPLHGSVIGAIVGGVLGGVAILGVFIYTMVFILRQKRMQERDEAMEPEMTKYASPKRLQESIEAGKLSQELYERQRRRSQSDEIHKKPPGSLARVISEKHPSNLSSPPIILPLESMWEAPVADLSGTTTFGSYRTEDDKLNEHRTEEEESGYRTSTVPPGIPPCASILDTNLHGHNEYRVPIPSEPTTYGNLFVDKLSGNLSLEHTRSERASTALQVRSLCGARILSVTKRRQMISDSYTTFGGLLCLDGSEFGLTTGHQFLMDEGQGYAGSKSRLVGKRVRLPELEVDKDGHSDSEECESSEESESSKESESGEESENGEEIDEDSNTAGQLSKQASVFTPSSEQPYLSIPPLKSPSIEMIAFGGKAFARIERSSRMISRSPPTGADFGLIELGQNLAVTPVNSYTTEPNGKPTFVRHFASAQDFSTGPAAILGHSTTIPLEAHVLEGSSMFLIPGSVFTTRKLQLAAPLPRGHSGAWVVRGETLMGYIIAVYDGLPNAHMLPISDAIAHIKESMGGRDDFSATLPDPPTSANQDEERLHAQ